MFGNSLRDAIIWCGESNIPKVNTAMKCEQNKLLFSWLFPGSFFFNLIFPLPLDIVRVVSQSSLRNKRKKYSKTKFPIRLG